MQYLLGLVTLLTISSVSAGDHIDFYANLENLKIHCDAPRNSSLTIDLELGRIVSRPSIDNKIHLVAGSVNLPGRGYNIESIIDIKNLGKTMTLETKLPNNKTIILEYSYGSVLTQFKGRYMDLTLSKSTVNKITKLNCELE